MPTAKENTIYDWSFFIKVAKRHKPQIMLAHVVALVAVFLSVPIPLLMPILVDEVLLHQPGVLIATMNTLLPSTLQNAWMYILLILVTTIALRIGNLGLGVWQTQQFTKVAKDVTYRIRRNLLQRLGKISMSEYETLGSGAVASYYVTDVNAIDEFIGSSLSKSLIAILSLIGISAVLLWMHWQLALFILLMNPLVIFFTVALGKRVKTLRKNENKAFELFQQSLVETLETIRQIRASNRESFYIDRASKMAEAVKNHSIAFSWKSDTANRFSFGVFLIGFDIFRAISMLMVVFSGLSVGQMMAVFGYLWFMMAPVQEILNIQYAFFNARAAMDRINRLLALQTEPSYPHIHNPFENSTTVSIQLSNIDFSYGGSTPVLKKVSLKIEAGEKVALVGASGGGKSTMVQIILGMYPIQSGSVLFNGIPVTQIGLDVVRENVASVLQHPAMFNDTVLLNLTLGKDHEEAEIWNAIRIAQLEETIRALPQGLNTIIGQQGIRLSGGQQQRLAIARMILSNPKVVILDEATSALDTHTEERLHRELQMFLQGKTTIIIAHRLSAVKQADRVYVFDDGCIIEHGGHEELIHARGIYQRLYGDQLL